MRAGAFLLFSALLFFLMKGDYFSGASYDPYIPEAADTAITLSQGQIIVSVQKKEGGSDAAFGQAFLVSDTGLIITTTHLFQIAGGTVEEISLHPEWISFNIYTSRELNFPKVQPTHAKLVYWSESLDVAVLQLEKIPYGLKPIRFARSAYLYEIVYAKIRGYSYDAGLVFYFDALPYRGTLVERALMFVKNDQNKLEPIGHTFFYLDTAAKTGFSGAMFVNEKGEVIGMGDRVSGGYTGIISAEVLKEVLNFIQKKEKKAS